jgi:nicotinamide mononucleotide (NMN) deamidase PncC
VPPINIPGRNTRGPTANRTSQAMALAPSAEFAPAGTGFPSEQGGSPEQEVGDVASWIALRAQGKTLQQVLARLDRKRSNVLWSAGLRGLFIPPCGRVHPSGKL